ncbi:ABC transporter substrate-binding protein [Oceanicella actignis]|uniref:Polar amino acid transport system substrate-binding protein/arginine/ornithine transport system substrate-binding protein n=1 Tax=Oceanicella actignis TaxID=1189325 RepID=A0A1M7TUW1_9RHOB|nr:ABC transporter substrate-binding protein [Oceanicella actignis]TYO90480.1 polar amino acid transport system substrate-binding protein/arginine/ornithine transport system substrate-binding protein [Oceanicella actignis]SES79142.1 amino acid ABC transporter substrate-binding protein, PAAT family (TC 3.A.1.3.-) [Oceanicella actignis]SHN74486.1 polar amino acid transport system substrate-binding protein/arginine/ornithine transport system substrate-binding protein [Oceanicella actignis]
MKNTIAAALAAFGLLTGAAGAADLRICVEGAYPPFSETTPSGELKGFDIDIAKALCDEMGKTCELVKTEWDGIIPALLERKCDAIIASMSITPERQKVIDFSDKYYNTPARFVARKGANIEFTPEGLKGKVVGVQRGTIHQDFMEGEFPGVELKLYGTQDEAYLDLAAGRVDALMADSVAIDDGFLKTEAGKDFEFVGPAYSVPKYHGEGAGIGVRKGDPMKDEWSKAIKRLRESGKYDEIMHKYFDYDIYGG